MDLGTLSWTIITTMLARQLAGGCDTSAGGGVSDIVS